METNKKLMNESELVDGPGLYWRWVGTVIYLTIIRPNISYVVSIVS